MYRDCMTSALDNEEDLHKALVISLPALMGGDTIYQSLIRFGLNVHSFRHLRQVAEESAAILSAANLVGDTGGTEDE